MITKDTNIMELLTAHPELEELFADRSLPCGVCSGAETESLEAAAAAHGQPLEELLAAIKEKLGESDL